MQRKYPKTSAGGLRNYCAAFIKALKYLRLKKHVDTTDTEKYVRKLAWNFTKHIRRPSQQQLVSKRSWLSWNQVLEVVKLQLEKYKSTKVTNRFDKARESQKLAILQLYTCIPPGRTHEYCSLRIRECTTDTFALENLKQNILTVSPSRLVLSIGDYKTSAAMGTQHREITGVQYLGTHMRNFLENHRPLLMNGKEHNFIFVVSCH